MATARHIRIRKRTRVARATRVRRASSVRTSRETVVRAIEAAPAPDAGLSGTTDYSLPSAIDAAGLTARVRTFILSHLADRLRAAELAEAMQVSEATVRRALLAETGLPVKAFVTNLRLDQAHAWLMTNRETRQQGPIARALGWRSAAAFARAYAHRFGETMTETRCRALRLEERKHLASLARASVTRAGTNIHPAYGVNRGISST